MTSLDPVDEPYAAASWLVKRHPFTQHLVVRLGAWTADDVDQEVDLHLIAEAINDADQLDADWAAYQDRTPPPSAYSPSVDENEAEKRYDAWRAAGPKTANQRAEWYGPMSSGEKRQLRMLAVLAPSTRVRFNLSDTTGVDQRFAEEWRQLIAGRFTK